MAFQFLIVSGMPAIHLIWPMLLNKIFLNRPNYLLCHVYVNVVSVLTIIASSV